MNITIFGLGYVGFTTACCLAKEGHRVTGIDVSEKKVRAITAGEPSIVEPSVAELLKEGLANGLIHADTRMCNHLDDCDLAIVCVGTPSAADGSHNMGYVADVTRQIANSLKSRRTEPLTVAYRSTIPPGSTENLIIPILRSILGNEAAQLVELVYNPEFLRESSAVRDYFNPPKIVIGTHDGQPSPRMEQLHRNIAAPTFAVRYREAEITKFVDNSWHAVKVTFANEIGRICLALGIPTQQVHEIFISDTKLNISPHYLRPGGAFGGSCLPKDVRALGHLAADCRANAYLIDSLLRSNDAHKSCLFEFAVTGLAPGAPVLLAGLTFKAGTDDLRESPNVDLACRLIDAGFQLEIYDSHIDAGKLVGANLGYAYSRLPGLDRILVTKAHAENSRYSRVIAANATISDLDLPEGTDLRDINDLP